MLFGPHVTRYYKTIQTACRNLIFLIYVLHTKFYNTHKQQTNQKITKLFGVPSEGGKVQGFK